MKLVGHVSGLGHCEVDGLGPKFSKVCLGFRGCSGFRISVGLGYCKGWVLFGG